MENNAQQFNFVTGQYAEIGQTGLVTSKPAFIVPLGKFDSESLHHGRSTVSQLGVYLQSDGDFYIEEWVTEPHPVTGEPYVMAMHMSVVEGPVLTRRLCDDVSSIDALQAAMCELGATDPEALLDHMSSCTTDPEWNELYNYIPVADWPPSRELEFSAQLTADR